MELEVAVAMNGFARCPLRMLALGATLAWALSGCAVNPVTGERELALISESQEVQLGAQSAQQVARSIGVVDDAALQAYVDRVGQALAANSERPELPWTFAVVDDPTPNAFALPGGYIFITRGLMSLLGSEAELAAVLGHEIGHVTARHSVSQLSRAQLAQLGLGLGSVLSPEVAQFGDLIGQGLSLLFLKYGRDDERQSDELGFRYMLEGGYDPAEMADVFAALMAASGAAEQTALPNWLATHPAEAERIETARARVAEAGPLSPDLTIGVDEHLNAIDGMVYGRDPRAGYFDGDTFHHPDLAFRFRLPESWQRANLPAAVQGIHPDQDAAAELTIVGADSAAAGAAMLFSQEGIAPRNSRETRLNGLPAIVSEFQAQGQGGIVQGYAAHIEHDGNVFQLMAFAPAQRFAARAPVLQEIITSFDEETDRDVLDVRPREIDVITVERDTTLAELARDRESPVDVEQLALINQLADPGARIAAGTRIKWVVAR